MRTTIDKAGRVVIPTSLRSRVGLERGGEVDIRLDGAAIRIEPVVGADISEEDGFLVIPATGEPIDDRAVREMIDADRQRD
jgi:AbrB family looped-hinge helix DNA binding protein